MGFILPLQAEHTLGKPRAGLVPKQEIFVFEAQQTCCFLDEVRKHIPGRVTHPSGKEHPWPALQLTAAAGEQWHCCSQTRACSTVWLPPKAGRSWTHLGSPSMKWKKWNHIIFNKGISHYFCLCSIREQKQRCANTGCTELLSWCVPQQHLTQVGVAGSWTKTRETPGLQGFLEVQKSSNHEPFRTFVYSAQHTH